jgi:hypothetical protein
MVAVIHSSSNLRNILSYNEHKVKAGLASCIEAAYYPKDAADLSFNQKLIRLEKLTDLNQQTKVNSVHISLNFDPSEKLSQERLREISEVYMEKIGFGGQPYLLYEHLDSGHPHVHIVTTNIKPDGKRIGLNDLGKNESTKARKEIEIAYGLIKAEDSKLQRAHNLKAVNAQKVQYGKTETKRAISNVLQTVLPHYKYASLAELNAVLKQYNIVADRGAEDSRVFRHHGLLYRLLDERGNRVGTPIKSSLFFSRPGLKSLEKKFTENTAKKEPYKARVRNAIDLYWLHGRGALPDFVAAMKKEGIDTVVRQNNDGVIYGITYIDHQQQSRCVFNGSALGKAYSAKGILERCGVTVGHKEKTKAALSEKAAQQRYRAVKDEGMISGLKEVSDILLVHDDMPERMDWQLKRKRKKRKRQKIQPE